MAFQNAKFNAFYQLLKETTQANPAEAGHVAENFILEERLPQQREENYQRHVGTSGGINDWIFAHKNYISEEINVSTGTPATFTLDNSSNVLDRIEENQFIVRIETIDWPTSLIGVDLNQMVDYLKDYLKSQKHFNIIEKFLVDWNRSRDFRPVFAGFWDEVKDIFIDTADNEIDNADWANQLRDRFGLGHYDPMGGEPLAVVLMRYRISDVMNAASGKTKIVAVPTVIDSDWSPFFHPTPIDGWQEGQTLDLSPGSEAEYSLNREILHRFIAYQPSYLYRVGWINKPPGKSCEEARRIHLKCLQDDFKNFKEIKR